MNFDLTEEEEMFKALAERFVSDHYDPDKRRAYLADADGFSHRNWHLLGELGLIAAPLDEDHCGLGLDPTGIATVFEALGYGLTVEPLIESILVAGRLFAQTAPEALAGNWLDTLASGEKRIALADAEAGSRGGNLWIETRAQTNGDGPVLTGSKTFVPAGSGVDGYIVTARSSGKPDAPEGVGLYFVPANSNGLTVRTWPMADGSVAASLDLESVRVPDGNVLSGNYAHIHATQTLANLARAAEALGIMRRLFAETQDYLRTRQQFGQPLASFQALQHRMVAQYAAIEQCRGLLDLALVSQGENEFAEAVTGLRAFIGPASIELGHEMIQMHGGMGVTDELPIGHGHKRLLVLSRWPDDPDGALDRFAGLN